MGNEIHREILKLILKHSASFARQILVWKLVKQSGNRETEQNHSASKKNDANDQRRACTGLDWTECYSFIDPVWKHYLRLKTYWNLRFVWSEMINRGNCWFWSWESASTNVLNPSVKPADNRPFSEGNDPYCFRKISLNFSKIEASRRSNILSIDIPTIFRPSPFIVDRILEQQYCHQNEQFSHN
jgi:hypothetical protein